MIKRNYSTKLTAFSQILRKNMTPEEKHLWYNYLKKLPLTVHRQKVIDCYIVDFYIAGAKLVIELDGSQHFTAKGKASDSARDSHLHKLGLTVLRYSNADIAYRFESVCADIDKHIRKASSSCMM
ncbi:MAG: endonuclease domain-containing protein [Clostridia bacterium]|nr:endonuclease domain-containing protein [Clostridia bacterium]